MKNFNTMIKTAVATLAVALLANASFAGIKGTAHDFSGGTGPMGAATGGQICLPCHTPHGSANQAYGKLWNHDLNTAQQYVMFTNPTYSTASVGAGLFTAAKKSTDGANYDLDNTSRLCLSCHDGASGKLDAFGGSATSGTTLTGATVLGTDLSNSHPVGDQAVYATYTPVVKGGAPTVAWDTTGSFNDITGKGLSLKRTNKNQSTKAAGYVTGAYANGVVSCYTCHDPHGGVGYKFLRIDNRVGSALCLTCHNK
jgi:predicted CXXCH cytochrome family protein